MPQTLTDKLVFITGASSGIGAACARAFAREGTRLLLVARRLERLETLAAELSEVTGRGQVCVARLDTTDRAAVERFLPELPAQWREIDILVNNAGKAVGLDKLQDGNVDDWEEMIDTNVKGLLYIDRLVLPGMVERKRGHVIHIGSIAGQEVYPGGNVYCATKFAVDAITRGLRMDVLGSGVRISTVDPGLVETEFSLVRFKGDAGRARVPYKGVEPLTPEDVADAVVFVATRPPHVNVAQVVLLAREQAAAAMILRETS
jgi:3-hydroxy acid dehydrogenase / malonic semialdehyde reductase